VLEQSVRHRQSDVPASSQEPTGTNEIEEKANASTPDLRGPKPTRRPRCQTIRRQAGAFTHFKPNFRPNFRTYFRTYSAENSEQLSDIQMSETVADVLPLS
jgi:hypothetical protein